MKELNEIPKKQLVAEAYALYREKLVAYAYKRIHDVEDAEDAVQDAFIRILNMGDMVCAATIRNLAFTVVQNILVDRLRGRVRKAEAYSYMYDFRSEASDENTCPKSGGERTCTDEGIAIGLPERVLPEPFQGEVGRGDCTATPCQPPHGTGANTERPYVG